MSEQNTKKEYVFGEIKEYDLEKIETEVLKESVYLDVFAGSDLTFKENCETLNGQKIEKDFLSLNAYKFNYKTEEYKNYNFPEGTQFGFMAQDVEGVFPELVMTDKSGKKFVNYVQLIPIMSETIKSLNSRVEELEKVILDLKKSNR